MVGAVIVTHGSFAAGLVDAAESITGDTGLIKFIGVNPQDSTDEIRERLELDIKSSNDGDGVIVFTDMFGGTPTNIALSFLVEDNVEILTGVNLPIILKFLTGRKERKPSELVRYLKKYGVDSIVPASDMLGKSE